MKSNLGMLAIIVSVFAAILLLPGTGIARSDKAEIKKLVFRDLGYMEGEKSQGNGIFSDVEGGNRTARIMRSWKEWEQTTSRWTDHWKKMGKQYAGYQWMAKYMSTVPNQMKKDRVFENGIVLFLAHSADSNHKVKIHDPILKNRTILINLTDVKDQNRKDEVIDYSFEHNRWLEIKTEGIDNINVYLNGKMVDRFKVVQKRK